MKICTSSTLILSVIVSSRASFQCSSHDECVSDSLCEQGRCQNPFVKGCLRTIAARKNNNNFDSSRFKMRVCNSDDATIIENSDCVKPIFPYDEVRIASGNWESSILVGWVYQILLSEVFGVPVTIETGSFDEGYGEISKRQHDGSFYDTESRFDYPDQVYPVDQLVEADRVGGDCSLTNKPCAHILPEVWEGATNSEITSAQEKGSVLSIESNGILGQVGYYIPSYTAERHRSFTSFYGLRGDENRVKLADIFKEPTTWVDFCELVHLTNCTFTDEEGMPKRWYPKTAKERDSYFVPDLYAGHFRVTDRTNCTKNPDTCKGNLIGPRCNWSTYVDSQMYWNKIGLAGNGPELPNNGYTTAHMIQIWKAANATKSHVLFWWWTPDMLVEEFGNSKDFSFQRIILPTTNEQCITYRAKELNSKKCSNSTKERRGNIIGACDYAVIPLKKVISRGLSTLSLANGNDALQSPAYEFLKQLYMPEYALPNIFRQWTRLKVTHNSADAPRESICEWVYDNFDELIRYSPRGFPRNRQTKSYSSLAHTGYVFGFISIILATATAVLTYVWRDHHILKSAQVPVLSSMSAGYFLAGISALLYAVVETTDAICTLQQWTLRLGYSLEVVPILIKVSALSRLGREARQFRRAQIDPNRFKKYISISMFALVTYMIIWTAVDVPKRVDNLDVIEGEVTIVALYAGCASKSPVWGIMALGWESLLQLSTTILTYQSREIIEQLNESNRLVFLVYIHSGFLMIRFMVHILLFSGTIRFSLSSKIISIILSVETIAAILVYFLPKFIAISKKEDFGTNQTHVKGGVTRLMNRRGSYYTGIKVPDIDRIPNSIMGQKDGGFDISSLCSPSLKKEHALKVPHIYMGDEDNGASGIRDESSSRESKVTFSQLEGVSSSDENQISNISAAKARSGFSYLDDVIEEVSSSGENQSTNLPSEKESLQLSSKASEDLTLTTKNPYSELERLRADLRMRNEEIDLLRRQNYEQRRNTKNASE